MVKIKYTTIFQAVFLLMDRSDVIAVPIMSSFVPASAPIMPEVYHNGITHRRILRSGIKAEQVSQEFLPTSPPPTQIIDKKYANEDQERTIKHALVNKQSGMPYRVSTDGKLTEDPKDACDPTYCCGKMQFKDDDGALLHETGCCHCNKSCIGTRATNSAESLILLGISGATRCFVWPYTKKAREIIKLACCGS
ncbi:secreted protein [Melampsora americana]|nr:secreted protein [Melampsora americana]